MEAEDIVASLRERVQPKQQSSVPEHFIELLNGLLDAAKIEAQAMLGGSYAKGTYLEGDHDVDVFVRFDKQYADEEMPDLLSLALGGLGGLTRIHGSRDYFQLDKDGFIFEIVPVLRVDDPAAARNVTDMSPLHVSYVRERLAKQPSLANDIRIAKLFCKAMKVYGAESFINGFSGHVLDLLLLHYGSFLSLLDAAAGWPKKLFLDPSGNEQDDASLNPAKRLGPLVLLDPVQPGRNAAAALSKERFDTFKMAARDFLHNPDEGFFVAKPLTKRAVVESHKGAPLLCYTLLPLAGARDVVGTKLLKAHEHLVKLALKEGFSLVDEGFEFSGEQAFCFIVVAEEPLPETKELQGPPAKQEKDAHRFREAHSLVTERDGRLFATEPRAHRTLDSLFLEAERSIFFKERALGAKVI